MNEEKIVALKSTAIETITVDGVTYRNINYIGVKEQPSKPHK